MNKDIPTININIITFVFFIAALILVSIAIGISFVNDKPVSYELFALFLIPPIIHFLGWIFIHQEPKNISDEINALNAKKESLDKKLKKYIEIHGNHREHNEYKKINSERKEVLVEYEKLDNQQKGIYEFCFFYNITMLISILLYCVGWIGYSFKTFIEFFSWYCLVGIGIQFLIISFATYVIMKDSNSLSGREIDLFWIAKLFRRLEKRECKLSFFHLKIGLETSPFWRFAHFFAIFVSISFLFGFAFAFHDLSYKDIDSKHPAIYIENLVSDKEFDSSKPKTWKPFIENIEEKISSIKSVIQNSSKNAVPTVCFYFESAKANIIAVDKSGALAEFKSLKPLKIQTDFMRNNENHKSFTQLLEQIKEKHLQGIPRITLIGRADDKRSDGVYPSNYELSVARTQSMRNEITKKLHEENSMKWQNADWLPVAYSNEGSTSQSKCSDLIYEESGERIVKENSGNPAKTPNGNKEKTVGDPDSGKRIVEVYLTMIPQDEDTIQAKKLQGKQMEDLTNKFKNSPDLMDYMYFSIYTITTTGYGDIKPATKYAKFLVSLENFFEVFFLVCFMNSLIALKSESRMSLESNNLTNN